PTSCGPRCGPTCASTSRRSPPTRNARSPATDPSSRTVTTRPRSSDSTAIEASATKSPTPRLTMYAPLSSSVTSLRSWIVCGDGIKMPAMYVLKSMAQNALLGLAPVRRYAAARHVTGIDGDPRRARELFAFYQRHGDCRGKDVLELGPGKTLDVLRIARHEGGAKSVAAADVTRYLAESSAARDGIDYRIYDGGVLPFADASKDLVWACYCMQHFRWPELSVQEIARVLRPGGRLVCRVDLRDHYHM